MKTLKSLALLPISFLAAGSVLAQPPDNVTSDSSGNTAMGTDALLDQTSGASSNTAAGFGALTKLTNASNNTAFGYQALTASTGAFDTAVGAGALMVRSIHGLSPRHRFHSLCL